VRKKDQIENQVEPHLRGSYASSEFAPETKKGRDSLIEVCDDYFVE